MDRSTKEALAQTYREIFAAGGSVVVSEYRGLRVAEMEELRRSMRAAGGTFCVIKNRIAKRALAGTPAETLGDLLHGPTALAWSEDEVAAAKITVEFAREHEALKPRGGVMGETVLDEAALKALAQLPSLLELRARLVGLLQAPAQKLAVLLQTPGGQMARLMTQKPDTLPAPAEGGVQKEPAEASEKPAASDKPAAQSPTASAPTEGAASADAEAGEKPANSDAPAAKSPTASAGGD